MKNLLLFILVILVCCIIWALPLYLVVNLTCWVFHLSFHLTLLQSFVLGLLLTIIGSLLSGKEK